jgi:hypothetical protein
LELKTKVRTYKMGTLCVGGVLVGGGRVKGGDEGGEIWLMGFIYIHEIE